MSAPGLIPGDIWREYLAALVKDPAALARHCADLAEACYGQARLAAAAADEAYERGAAEADDLGEAADRYSNTAGLLSDAAGVITGHKTI